jgi:16S rRNA (uracil1498-N3)-methyltransferase
MTRLALAGAHAHVFVAELPDALTIDGADGHHLQRVLRLAPGEVVTAADGSGTWRRYVVRSTRKGALELDADGAIEHDDALSPTLVAAVAVLPRARLERVVAPLSELGVDELLLVHTERVQANVDARLLMRLAQLARESAMQCRRARPLAVAGPVPLAEVVTRGTVVVADPAGGAADAVPKPPQGGGWVVLNGPEGGFGPADAALLGTATRLQLGPNVLRAETAAVVAAAVLTQRRSLVSLE